MTSPARMAVQPGLRAWSLLPRERRRRTLTLKTCTPGPTTGPIDRPTSPSAAVIQLLCVRVVGEDDRRAAAVAKSPSASPPPLYQPSQAPTPALEEDWEIRKIVDRPVEKGYKNRVRWKDTWLRRSEQGNAHRLLQDFETECRAHGGRKQGKSSRADKLR